jgi:hypothetical protein
MRAPAKACSGRTASNSTVIRRYKRRCMSGLYAVSTPAQRRAAVPEW